MASKNNLKRSANTLDGFVLKAKRIESSSNAVTSEPKDSEVRPTSNVNTTPSCFPSTAQSLVQGISNSTTTIVDISDFVTERNNASFNIDDNIKYMLLTKDASKDLLNYKFPVKNEGNHTRSFQLSWTQKNKWIVYSRKQNGVYCKHCVLFGRGTSHNSVVNLLITQPLTKWKKALEIFAKHSLSQYHRNSVLDSECFLKIYKQEGKSVQEIADSARAKRVAENREKLNSIVKTIIFHGRENIPLRGHREDNCSEILSGSDDYQSGQGIFRAMLKFRVDAGDVVLKEHLENCPKNAVYVSPRVQNEMIDICGNIIREKIVEEIKESPYFTVLFDETSDVAGIEQASLCIRYLKNDQIVENFLTFVAITNTSGENLAAVILTTVENFGLDLNKLRGQGYDGASNMAGMFKGVQARIIEKYPHAIYTHCCNHALNLVIVTSTNSSSATQSIKNMIGVVKTVTNFVRDSALRRDVLKKHLSLDPRNLTSKSVLQQLCETRWSERHSALLDFLKFLPSIVHCLEEINEIKPESNAFSLLHSILNFEFLLCLSVCAGISGLMFPLSKYLQKENRDLFQARKHVELLQSSLNEKRSNVDSSFATIFEEAVQLAENLDVEVKTPRICGRQTQRGNVTNGSDVQFYFKVNIYIPFLDHSLAQLSERFGKKFQQVSQLEYFIPSYIDKLAQDSKAVEDALSSLSYPDIDKVSLTMELGLWRRKWKNEEKDIGVIPTSPLQTLPFCNGDLFPNIRRILELLCVLPVTVAEGERSFSTLRRLKTWLRSTTSESRLNGLAALNIHKQIEISAEEVVERFSNARNRRMDLIF